MSKDILNHSCWIVVGASNLQHPYNTRTSARLVAKKPTVKSNEVAIKVELSLPRTLFVRPQLQASIAVKEGEVTPPKLDLEVVDDLESVLRERSGLDITLRAVDQDE